MATPPLIVSPRQRATNWQQDDDTKLWTRRFSYRDFAAGAVTGDKDVEGFPGGLEILGVYFWLITNFTGGGAGSATLSAGSTGTVDAYVAATSVFSGARKIVAGKTLVPGTFVASTPTSAGTIRFRLTADVNTNLLTAGAVDVYIRFQGVSLRVS